MLTNSAEEIASQEDQRGIKSSPTETRKQMLFQPRSTSVAPGEGGHFCSEKRECDAIVNLRGSEGGNGQPLDRFRSLLFQEGGTMLTNAAHLRVLRSKR